MFEILKAGFNPKTWFLVFLLKLSTKVLAAHHGNLLQYSCLENPTDRGAWQARVPRVA